MIPLFGFLPLIKTHKLRQKKKKIKETRIHLFYFIPLVSWNNLQGNKGSSEKRNNVHVEAAGSRKWTLEGEEGKDKRD